MATPFASVEEWLAAFERGDLDAARRLLADDAVLEVFASGEEPVELRGFDGLVAWYARRRELLGPSFEYSVHELLPGDRYAVALISMSRTDEGQRTEWRQVAVYAVEDGVITAVRAYEEPAERSGHW